MTLRGAQALQMMKILLAQQITLVTMLRGFPCCRPVDNTMGPPRGWTSEDARQRRNGISISPQLNQIMNSFAVCRRQILKINGCTKKLTATLRKKLERQQRHATTASELRSITSCRPFYSGQGPKIEPKTEAYRRPFLKDERWRRIPEAAIYRHLIHAPCPDSP